MRRNAVGKNIKVIKTKIFFNTNVLSLKSYLFEKFQPFSFQIWQGRFGDAVTDCQCLNETMFGRTRKSRVQVPTRLIISVVRFKIKLKISGFALT